MKEKTGNQINGKGTSEKTNIGIKGMFENCKKKLKCAFKKCREKIKETYKSRKKAYINGFASVLTIILLVSIFSMQFQINKTDIINTTSAQQLASSSKYVIYNIDDEELPVTDNEGNEIVTKQVIDGKTYYVLSTDENGKIKEQLSQGVYKVVELEGTEGVDQQYQLSEKTSFIQVGENSEVSEIEVQEFNITNTYVGPEISSKKSFTTQYGEDFVVEGEIITYTITVENSGHMEKQVVVKDTIPDGTTLEPGSIKVEPKQDNVDEEKVYTEDELKEGIVVTVPAIKPKDEIQSESASNKNSDSGLEVTELDANGPKEVAEVNEQEGNTTTGEEADGSVEDESEGIKGKVTITFQVKVNNLDKGKYSKKIENTAMVDDEPTATIEVMVNKEVPVQLDEIEVTNSYIGPVISEDKTFTTQEGEAYVKENEEITYQITVENSGLVAKNVKIKDEIPVGTTFKPNSILVDGQQEYKVDKKVTDDAGTHIDQDSKNTTSLTELDLTTNGIELTVPAGQQADDGSITNGKVTLTFIVTVNEFGDEANGKPDYSKTIVNMAEVDDVPTRKVVVVATKNVDGTTKDVTIIKKDSKDKTGLAGAQFTLEPKKINITKSMQTVQVKPALKVTKEITSTPKNNETYEAGERIKCAVTVKNTGNVALTGVKVKDTVLENVENTTSTLIATYEDETNEFTLSKDLLAGESKKITYDYIVTEQDTEEGTLTNKSDANAQSITVTAKAITSGNDTVTATNIAESALENVNTYTFTESEEKYVSNNKVENSKAIAYIPIDLTVEGSYTGKNTLVVNAKIDGGISDYGYAMVIEGESIPEDYKFDDIEKAFIAINGQKDAQDYKITLDGNKKYTLILIYAKDEIADEDSLDAFTINSVKVVQNEGGKEETITLDDTGEDGTTNKTLPYGIYTLTETKAPENYKKLEESISIEIGETNRVINNSTDEKIQISVDGEGNFVVENTTSRVIVHHHLKGASGEDTGKTVADDEELKGVSGTGYTTKGKENLEKYEREKDEDGQPKKPVDKEGHEVDETGTFGEEDKEVTYYYVWKKAEIESNLTKTSEILKVTQKDQQITYQIKYTATISQYEGKATITIVDHLPYKLDLEKMQPQKENLADGEYSEANNTITWTITENEINTYSDGEDQPQKEITINKEIKLVFKDIDANATEIKNTVDATLNLETTNQTDKKDPVEKTIPAEFNKDVTVTKTWDYGNEKNIYPRPTKIKLELYDQTDMNTKIGETEELTGEEGEPWTYTFKNLKRFNKENEEIIYTVKELPADGESLDYYESKITPEANTITIVNTYKGPEISSNKTVEIYSDSQKIEEETRNYALVKDTLKYTITVTNAGGVDKEVIIKDEIPSGTTFKQGSMKINEDGTYKVEGTAGEVDVSTKTDADLKNGIKVTVPKATPGQEEGQKTNGQITLSFEVSIIDDLSKENSFMKHINNTATIVDEDAVPEKQEITTDETDTLVNKANIEFSKTSTQEQGSKIPANGEIEYIIEVKNTGTAPETVTIKDSEPEGTTYKTDSFSFTEDEIQSIATGSYTMDNLKSGITLELAPNKKITIKFTVTVNEVNDYSNGDDIINKASVNGVYTAEVKHRYVEPIISQEKTATVERKEGYVLEGELITYTITVTNKGEQEKQVTIKDTIPQGVTPEAGTLTIEDGNKQNLLGEHTIDELQSAEGLKITVPAAEDKNSSKEISEDEYAKVILTFKVKVDTLADREFEKTITNKATVDDQETETTTTDVKKPNVTISKLAVTPDAESDVEVGDEITYKILLDNTNGTVEDTVRVKDILPTGVSAEEAELEINEVGDVDSPIENEHVFANLVGEGIEIKVPAGKKIAITYKVKVTGTSLDNDTPITNKAQIVDTDKEGEVTHNFVKPLISSAKTAKIVSTNQNHEEGYALEGDKIEYTITLTNVGGADGTVTVKDTMPEEQVTYSGDEQIKVKVNGEDFTDQTYTIQQLISQDGIEVTVPAASKVEERRTASTVTLTFNVTVKENIAIDSNGYKIKVTNTANVDEDEPAKAETEVRKEHITAEKTAEPVTGQNVKETDKIKYTITITNDGTAPKKVTVKDIIPQGTTYEQNSVEVKGATNYVEGGEYRTDEEDGNRIETEVIVPAATEELDAKNPGKVTITFEVKVENLNNGEVITNTATVDGKDTDPVTHTYVEPIIKSQKKAEIVGIDGEVVSDRKYALEGEKIRYTITVTNEGDLKGNVTIQDNIPSGTSFVTNSIKVDGSDTYQVNQSQQSTVGKSETDLQTGIEVEVPGRTQKEDGGKKEGQVTLSFEVTIQETVGEPYLRKIENTATVKHDKVDGEDESPKSEDITVNKPHVTIEKKSDTADTEVSVGEEITYVITATNDGFAPQDVTIKDSIPEGTEYKEESLNVKVGGLLKEKYEINNLTEDGINITVPAATSTEDGSVTKGTVTVEFVVKVTGKKTLSGEEELENGYTIQNKATIIRDPEKEPQDTETTDPVEHTFVKPIISAEKQAEILNTDQEYAIAGDEIEYTITLKNAGDYYGEVTVKDTIPQGTTLVENVTIEPAPDETHPDGYTQDELSKGIKVKVAARDREESLGTTVIKFKVRVSELTEEDSHTKKIKNIAYFDDDNNDETPDKEIPSKEITVNESAIALSKTEEIIDEALEDNDKEAKNVKIDSKIKYTITVNNSGTAEETVKVTDQIPEGTRFETGSIKINGNEESDKTEEDLTKTGIDVKVEASGSATIEFTVVVTGEKQGEDLENKVKLNNGEKIKNIAKGTYGNEKSTDSNEVEHTYIEPIINSEKKATIQNPELGYVKEGEEITYEITVKNTGSYKGEVTVEDTIPQGTKFVQGSLKVTGDNSYSGGQDYNEGTQKIEVTVTVPAATNEVELKPGEVKIKFRVKVQEIEGEDLTKTITNTAKVTHKGKPEDVESKPVTENKAKLSIEKKIKTEDSEVLDGGKVALNNEITYVIYVKNSGPAKEEVKIKDLIPDGTELIAGSIKIDDNNTYNDENLNEKDKSSLENGLEVTVPARADEADGQVKVEFRVKVIATKTSDGKLADREEIKNKASVEDEKSQTKDSNEVKSTYVEPIISSTKKAELVGEDGLKLQERDYALEGDTIKYTITVLNKGGIAKDVKIKDEIPNGTQFVTGSIDIDPKPVEQKTYEERELTEDGITVNVPAATTTKPFGEDVSDDEAGKVTLSFKVKVKELDNETYEKTISNTAHIDDNEEGTKSNDIEVKKPKVSVQKSSKTANNKVKTGDQIVYTITVINEGTAPEKVLVKDTIPEGTELVTNGIKIGGKVQTGKNAQHLAEGLEVTVPAATQEDLGDKVNGQVEVEVTVKVTGTKTPEGKLQDREKIENIAKIDEDPTNPNQPENEKSSGKVEHKYVEPIIESSKTSKIYDKKGGEVSDRSYALEGETIEYTITVTNKGGLAKDVLIKDTIPEGTHFKDGSIEVNGEGTNTAKVREQQKAANTIIQTELANGVVVNVPAAEDKEFGEVITDEDAGKTTLSFKVIVSDLTGETYKSKISNTAYVDNSEEGTPAEDVEVKKPHVTIKKESTTAGQKVPENTEITYTITLTNDGYAPADVVVKDVIPEGTEYKSNTLTVNSESKDTEIENLKGDGLTVKVPAKDDEKGDGKVTIQFTVNVTGKKSGDAGEVELANKTTITNTATLYKDPEDKEDPEKQEATDPVEHTFVKPIITSKKEAKIKGSDLSYALAGDKIEYTITITNAGDYKGTVRVQDSIPEGVTCNDEDAVTVTTRGNDVSSSRTIKELKDGFDVEVPAKVGSQNGQVTITFEVTVNALTDHTSHKKTITNTATVGKDTPSSNTVVNEAALAVSKTATVKDEGLEQEDIDAKNVKVGSTITYTITVSNAGTAPETVKVEDAIPEGTKFVAKSVKVDGKTDYSVNGQEKNTEEITEQQLKEGIDVDVPAKNGTNGKVVITFDVTVTGEKLEGKLENGNKITNVGKIKHKDEHEDESKPVENTFIEPVIESTKTAEIFTTEGTKVQSSSRDYALERETIKYSITVKNTGAYKGKVTIKDVIPTGTTFVQGSIEVTGAEETAGSYTEEQLKEEGITLTVPAAKDENHNSSIEGDEAGVVVLTFKVTVDKITGEELTKQIGNKATVTVDGKEEPQNPETTVTVKKPKIEVVKSAEVKSSATKVENTDVTEGDAITYKIKFTNSGDAPGKVNVKDVIPQYTEIEPETIKVNDKGTYGGKNLNDDETKTLTEGIDITVPARKDDKDGEVTLEFTVDVQKAKDQTKIQNYATVKKDPTDPDAKEEQTNIVTNKYVEPIIESEKSYTIEGVEDRTYAIEEDIIKYTITVTNKGGLEKQVTIIDDAPIGTTFEQESIEVTGAKEVGQSYTLEQLKGEGIKLTVPAAQDSDGDGQIGDGEEKKVTLSFKVKVDKLDGSEYTKVIENTATVDDSPTTETQTTVNKPNIDVHKTSDTTKKVKVNDKITYKITVTNKGEAFGKVKVKDTIPQGTEFESLTIEPTQQPEKVYTKQDIEDGIDITMPAAEDTNTSHEIEENEYTKVELTLVVNVTGKGAGELELEDGYTIDNVAKYTVDEKETDTEHVTNEYVKPVISSAKTSSIEEGTKVKSGDEITYTITLTNEGGTATNVKVSDEVPAKTTFKQGSIKVNDTPQPDKSEDDLRTGIDVPVTAQVEEIPGTGKLEFTVKVNNMDEFENGEKISNVATVGEEQTEKVENTYAKPIITSEKKAQVVVDGAVQEARDYVAEGEKIRYTIKVTNSGDAEGTVTIKDTISDEVEFVPDSIKVKPAQVPETTYSKDNLESGIQVKVPAKTDEGNGELTLTFDVTVKEGVAKEDNQYTKQIVNNATVTHNKDEEHNEEQQVEAEITLKKEHITSTKQRKIQDASGREYALEGDLIEYTITVENDGTLEKDVKVVDNEVRGAEIQGKITVDPAQKGHSEFDPQDLATGITVNVPAKSESGNGKVTLKFKAKVSNLTEETYTGTVSNTAQVDDDPVTSTEVTVNKSNITATKTSAVVSPAAGLDDGQVTEGSTIRYTITINNTNGTAPETLTVKDTIPEHTALVEGSMKIDGSLAGTETEGKLESGIEVTLEPNGTKTIVYDVEVKEGYTDGDDVQNNATVGKIEVNATNKYVESIISSTKEGKVENGKEYALEGDMIVYTITIKNKGQLEKEVTVRDSDADVEGATPEGKLTIAPKPTGEPEEGYDVTALSTGIKVNVPAGTDQDGNGTIEDGEEGVATVVFKAKVDKISEGYEATVTNTAHVDETPVETEEEIPVKKPHIEASKTSDKQEATVKANDTITYTITLDNKGTAPGTALVKDEKLKEITGISYDGSSTVTIAVKDGDSLPSKTINDLIGEGISVEVPAGKQVTLTFTVTVTGNTLENEAEITNIANVDGQDTEEVTDTFVKPIIEVKKKAEIKDKGDRLYAIEGDTITYIIEVTNKGGAEGTVNIKEQMPEEVSYETAGKVTVKEVTEGVAGEEQEPSYTIQNLLDGQNITVEAGKTLQLSFDVTVKPFGEEEEETTKTVVNKVVVDNNDEDPKEAEITVNTASIAGSKKAEIIEGADGLEEKQVTKGTKIKYTISVQNSGDADGKATVKDIVPEHTKLVAGSVEVEGDDTYTSSKEYTEQDRNIEVEVNVPLHQTVKVSFEVIVEDSVDGTVISNSASINDKPTNKEEYTYVEPVISATKTASPETGSKVVAGQDITYTITVTNNGGAKATATVKDTIPTGTTFKEGSIKVNGAEESSKGQTELESGIEVEVPAKSGDRAGTVTVEFTVTVKSEDEMQDLATIENQATVKVTKPEEQEDITTDTVTHTYTEPNISASKKAEPANGTVKVGDTIKYTITVTNSGNADGKAVVKDVLPKGVQYSDGFTVVGDKSQASHDIKELTSESGMTVTVPAKSGEDNGTVTISFTVTVVDGQDDNAMSNGDKIVNKATVNGNITTETVEHTYVEPDMTAKKEAEIEDAEGTKVERKYALEGDIIKYTITVKNKGGANGEATVKDTIPQGTSFVTGSIEIDGVAKPEYNDQSLSTGIKVTVPKATNTDDNPEILDTEAGKVTVSFKVTVNPMSEDELTEQIENTANVNGAEVESDPVEVDKPQISITKSSDPENKAKVQAGDEITYTIKVANKGTALEKVVIKDSIPDGTEFIEDAENGNIKVTSSDGSVELQLQGRVFTKDDLTTNGIEVSVPAGKDINEDQEIRDDEAGTVTVSFKVKVTGEGKTNGQYIENTATLTEEPESGQETTKNSNKVQHKYVEPIISSNKTAQTQYGKTYVVAGEEITYTITLTNEGDLEKEVLVKDTIPNGTDYVEESLQVKIGEETTSHELTELTGDGIKVKVPAATDETPLAPRTNGTATVTFKVKVKASEQLTDITEITNVAEVNKDPDNPEPGPEDPNVEHPDVKTSLVTYEKTTEITRADEAESTLQQSQVTVGDTIKYIITVNNKGSEAVQNITVEDTVPEGTTLIMIDNGDQTPAKDKGSLDEASGKITWTIDEIPAGTSKQVSFTVKVKYTQDEEVKVTNVAKVDGKDTNTTEHEYVKPEAQVLDSKVTKTSSTPKIVTKDGKVSYEIAFTAKVDKFVGKARITMVDTLPYPLDLDVMKQIAEEKDIDTSKENWLDELLMGGKYEETDDDGSKKYTITWVEYAEDIDTFRDGDAQEITRTKTLELKYIYGKLDGSVSELTNKVEAKIELLEPSDEEDVVVKTDTPEPSEVTIPIEIESTVTTHHYIYDSELPEGQQNTTKQLADDETQTGNIGEHYTTAPSEKVPANYECVTPNPDGKDGVFEDEDKEVTYYYELKTPQVSSEIDKAIVPNTAVTEEKVGEEPEIVTSKVLTKEGGVVEYDITYTAHVKDYIGKVKVEIVDTLPAPIDKSKSNLQDGEYDPDTNTITWTETINDVDTFANNGGDYANGIFTKTFTKHISLVYVVDDPVGELENTVTGSTKVYYPDIHTTTPGEEQDVGSEDPEDTDTLTQDYKMKFVVEKVWEDEENHPEAIDITINAKDARKLEDGRREDYSSETQRLSADNNWTYTEEEILQKYDEDGNRIEYVVTEYEVNDGDLEDYAKPKVEMIASTEELDNVNNYIIRVTNSYVTYDMDLDQEMTKEVTKINGKNYGTVDDDTTVSAMTSATDKVSYRLQYSANLEDYEGEKAKWTIVDTLPYAIDEDASSLDGGVYKEVEDPETGITEYRITWSGSVEHIVTDINGRFTITKDITLVFKDIDVTKDTLKNTAEGRILLDSEKNGPKDEVTTTVDMNIQGKVIVKYVEIDENGTEKGEIAKQEEIQGRIGSSYNTDVDTNEAGEKLRKDIPGYVLDSDNEKTKARGTFGEEEQTVTYYYTRAEGKVTTKYVDENGNDIIPPQVQTGKVGDPFETEQKTFDGYRLKEVQGDREGTYTEGEQTVTYVYERIPAEVIVRYLEKGTNEELAPQDTIEGHVGEPYQASRKAIENYRAAEPEPTNSTGNMTEATITVTYYYERIPSGTVRVKYLDVDTKEELTYMEEHPDGTMEEKTYGYDITGNAGDKYTTEEKEIPYYNLFKKPENASGELSEDGDTVIYYYQKKPFNFSIEKIFRSVILNGDVKNITNNKSTKVEIVAATIPYAQLEVTYRIIVRNTGEIDGKAKVIEMLPQGYRLMNPANYWAQKLDGTLESIVELKAGETKELEVTLQWINSNDNFGIFDNTAKLVDIENPANFKETSTDDNTATAELITSIKTGMEENIILIVTGIGLIITLCVLVYLYEKYNKERGIPMRKIKIENKKIVIKKEK